MENIKCLSGSVHSSLRASVFLFDIARVVEELILNSLDAGATKVDVCVNVGACYVKVEDDGFGITRDGLALLGERHATSKHLKHSGADDYIGELGSRGEALSSLSDISLLEVVTRARSRPNAYRKVMKGRNCLFLGIEEDKQNDGTTVIVRDLFYNQPVRRKSMQASPKKVLLSVRKCILQVALVHPTISLNLIDLESERELFHMVPSSSPLPLVSSHFGTEISSSLHEVSYLDENFKLNGFLSGPHGTGLMKVFQYLYINSRHVSRGPIHKLINCLASGFPSSLKYLSAPELGDTRKQRTQDCPAYLLNLRCPISSYDLTFEPSKTVVEFKDWAFILSFIERAVWNSWKQSPGQSFLDICAPDIPTISTNLEKKSHHTLGKQIPFKFLKRETDFGYQVDSRKRKASHSRGVSNFLCDELIFRENDKPDLWIPDDSFSDLDPKSWEKEDYQRMGMQMIKGDGGTLDNELACQNSIHNSYERRSQTWNFPSLTRCAQSLDLYEKDFFSSEGLSEKTEELSDQMDETTIKFNEGGFSSPCKSFTLGNHYTEDNMDRFTVSFDLMGGSVDKKRQGRLSAGYHLEDNDFRLSLKPVQGSKGCGFSDFSDDSKYFHKTFGDDALCFDLERGIMPSEGSSKRFKSKKVVSSNSRAVDFVSSCGRYIPTAQTNAEEFHCCCSKNSRRRSRSAPPFYKCKRKISVHVISETNCKNVDVQHSYRTANSKVNASQPSGIEFGGVKDCGGPMEDADQLDFLNSDPIKWRTHDSSHSLAIQDSDDILDISSGMLQMSGNSLVPESISRETLKNAKVLLQIDRKFIPAVAGEVLIAIDQHAADERIRLEELRKKVISGEGCSITYLDSEQELALPEIGFQLIQNYEDQVKRWGWLCSSHVHSSGSFSRNLSMIKKKSCNIALIAVPCILGINLSKKDLLEYLEQLADTDGASSMPPSVIRILNFKACRGAIMFGDPLLPSECSLIIDELKETSLCFQCAHGRPTTVPLVDLAELRRQLAKLRLQAGVRMAAWHGLLQHRPDVGRAQARLRTANKNSIARCSS